MLAGLFSYPIDIFVRASKNGINFPFFMKVQAAILLRKILVFKTFRTVIFHRNDSFRTLDFIYQSTSVENAHNEHNKLNCLVYDCFADIMSADFPL